MIYELTDGRKYHRCQHETGYAGKCGITVFTDNILDKCKSHQGKDDAVKRKKVKSNFNRWQRDTTGGQ